jgi:glycine/D-amino acid oxidase-like deaminating enzyme
LDAKAIDNFFKMTTTVILGTGIIGVSTAYDLSLSRPPSTIHLVEASGTLFASASLLRR